MKQYLDLMSHVMENGSLKPDRTGTGTKTIFGYQMRFNLEDGFPCVTTKKLHLKSIIHELLWFLKGDTNIKYLKDNGVKIWDEWADENGDLGHVYGYQWRSWPTPDGKHIDQIQQIISQLKENPNSRRIIVSAWNVGEIENMALPPCHVMSQFYISNQSISCHMYQRSADMFLGVPFNIASYALLLSIFAEILGLKPKRFIHSFGDAHIYKNSIEQVKEQISRTPRSLPKLIVPELNSIDDLKKYSIDDFILEDYDPHPQIKAEMAV